MVHSHTVHLPLGALLTWGAMCGYRFTHDFNLLYLRRLLRVSWITPSWQFNAASTGSSVSFELHLDPPPAPPPPPSPSAYPPPPPPAAAYRVQVALTSASVTQQRDNVPLTPPQARL